MHRSIFELDLAIIIDPGQRMFHPVVVITIRIILACMRAATLETIDRRSNRRRCIEHEILEFHGLDQVGIPDQGPIRDCDIAQRLKCLVQ